MDDKERDELFKEEVRGIFTLGLMAILVTVRVGLPNASFTYLGVSYPFSILVDPTLIFWGAYSLFIVLGLSSDILKEHSKRFMNIASVSLAISFVFLITIGSFIFFTSLANFTGIIYIALLSLVPPFVILGYYCFQIFISLGKFISHRKNSKKIAQ